MAAPEQRAAAPAECAICTIIAKTRAGENPNFVMELPQSFVVLGDAQLYRGYCILLAKHHATELHLMPRDAARALFDEAVTVGAAIASVTQPLKLNYECLGNAEPHVHWHIFPRYANDPMRRAPIWARSEAERKVALNDRDRRALIDSLRAELKRRVVQARFEPDR
jgi:diadenosine tetraphosphate (Ap4A) HIT family hydrolase